MDVKVEISIGKGTDRLNRNLEDLLWSLDKNLGRHSEGSGATGGFDGGTFMFIAKDTSIEIVKEYMDAFEKSMRKLGERLIISITVLHT
jgi:hypothetical protein